MQNSLVELGIDDSYFFPMGGASISAILGWTIILTSLLTIAVDER